MRAFLLFFRHKFRYFFINPFWFSKASWFILGFTLIGNAAIWFFYLKQYHFGIGLTPIVFSSAVIILNLFLAVIMRPKEIISSFVLLSTSLLIQVLILIFMRFTFMMGNI